MSDFNYNLREERWIPYVDAAGNESKGGLVDVLKNAHKIRSLSFENPMHELSVLILLITLAHRVTADNIGGFAPVNFIQHKGIIESGELKSEKIDRYFEKWKERFNLFDEKYPFFQTKGLMGVDSKDINKVIAPLHISSILQESYKVFFNHAIKDIALEFAKVPPILLMLQYMNVGGLNKKTTNLFGYQQSFYQTNFLAGISMLYYGDTLFETLVNNLLILSLNINNFESGTPIWENEQDIATYRPDGYLGYLTTKSRHIRLIPEVDNGINVVKSYYIAQGYKYPDEVTNPFYLYKNSKKNERITITLNTERSLWRDSHSFLVLNNSNNDCKVLKIQKMFAERSNKKFFDIAFYGFENDKANPISIRKEVLTVPRAILEDELLKSRLNEAVTFAEEVSKSLYFAIKFLIEPEEKKVDGSKITGTGIQYAYWSRLDILFYEFLKLIECERSLKNWKDDVKIVAFQSLDEGSSGFGYKAIAKARNVFEKNFYKKEKK